MSKPIATPTRLSHLSETEDALGVGRMFRNALELPDEELPRLRWRLRTSLRLCAVRPRLVLRAALVVFLVFCMGGVVGAVISPLLIKKETVVGDSELPGSAASPKRRRSRPAPAVPASAAPFEAASDKAAPVVPVPNPAEPMSAVLAPKPVTARPVTPRPGALLDEPKPAATVAKHRASPRVAFRNEVAPPPAPGKAAASVPPPTAPSAIAVEQALVGQAVRILRDGHDARGALALLAQHAERFPAGALVAEATMLRIEALLALGHRDEALAVLDGVPLASLPNRAEQLVVRGELRAARGRWREAKQDFDDVLRDPALPAAGGKARDRQERALWGRAAARSRLGDQGGARADLELYLRHFPRGRFASPAESFLKGVP